MWKPANAVDVSRSDRDLLETLVRGGKPPQRVVLRANIVLGASAGRSNNGLAKDLGVTRPTVLLWRERYARSGIGGLLKDAPRPGRPKQIGSKKVETIVNATLHTTPRDATHWSTRTMARSQGVSQATVTRIWQAHGLQPHPSLTPPAGALPRCVDEKTKTQALDRTQPALPMRPGLVARHTHDYVRHGTTTLFAALNVLEGTVIGSCLPRHRHEGFLTFMERGDRATPPRREIHLVLDNYGTHKHAEVKAWFAAHQSYHLHFVPTGSSWLNLVG